LCGTEQAIYLHSAAIFSGGVPLDIQYTYLSRTRIAVKTMAQKRKRGYNWHGLHETKPLIEWLSGQRPTAWGPAFHTKGDDAARSRITKIVVRYRHLRALLETLALDQDPTARAQDWARAKRMTGDLERRLQAYDGSATSLRLNQPVFDGRWRPLHGSFGRFIFGTELPRSLTYPPQEYFAAASLGELIRLDMLDKVAWCASRKCHKWFFAGKGLETSVCSDRCRKQRERDLQQLRQRKTK
jgi:hypothetical protein